MKTFLYASAIEIKRGGGGWIFAIAIAAILLTDLRYLTWDNLAPGYSPTWYWISGTGTTITGLYPLVAGFGAWLGGREARSRTVELHPPLQRRWGVGVPVPAITGMIIWISLAIATIYGLIAMAIAQRAYSASGSLPAGSVPWQGPLVVLAAFLATAVWGYTIGLVIRRPIAPLLAIAAVYVVFQLPLLLDNQYWLRMVIPYDLSHRMAPYINDAVYPRLLFTGLAWFGALALTGVAAIYVFIRQERLWVMGFLSLIVISIVSGWQVVVAADLAPAWHARERGQACVELRGVSYCAPSAALSQQQLQANAQAYDVLFPNWFPASLLPNRFELPVGGEETSDGSLRMISLVQSGRLADSQRQALMIILNDSSRHPESLTASQLAFVCVLLRESDSPCQPYRVGTSGLEFPDAIQSREVQALFGGLEPGQQMSSESVKKLESMARYIDANCRECITRFEALSDAEKAAWFRDYWDRLVAGDLSIEECVASLD